LLSGGTVGRPNLYTWVFGTILLPIARGPWPSRPVLMLLLFNSILKLGSSWPNVHATSTVVFPGHPAEVGSVITRVAETKGAKAATATRRDANMVERALLFDNKWVRRKRCGSKEKKGLGCF